MEDNDSYFIVQLKGKSYDGRLLGDWINLGQKNIAEKYNLLLKKQSFRVFILMLWDILVSLWTWDMP